MSMKFIYGPIPSRRLGRSLGISPIPNRTCNHSCIYCQLGRTLHMTNERQEFFKVEEIINEMKEFLSKSDAYDVVTIVGNGEPTLYSKLGELISELKKLTSKPIAVITNGSLLNQLDVQNELMEADIVLPSLNGYDKNISKFIDRPYGKLVYEDTIQGIIDFSHKYKGEIWIEIMLMNEINDDKESIEKYKELLGNIKYSRLYLNTPVRPPAESRIQVSTHENMIYASKELGGISIDVLSSEDFSSEIQDDFEAVYSLCKRHPMNQFELISFLEKRKNSDIQGFIKNIERNNYFNIIDYKGIKTYRLK